ncbi:MAG: hypothetical protein D6784_04860 [Chloroflexi bacterium]|nr:MAG: hypothetical protein D6784_04860 [Chloroflexota bacterium]
MELFPALLIGGPPHSGKSVLAYNLSQAFRCLGLEHYLLRAAPDGEGDWSNEADQSLVRAIRVKNDWSRQFVDNICRDIANRHLPLLVDVGGRPEPWQKAIFGQCTHAVLIAATPQALDVWRLDAHRHNLTVLAELKSTLEGEPEIYSRQPVFQARLTNLQRGQLLDDPVFNALVDHLQPYFRFSADELRQIRRQMAPVDSVVELTPLARTLGVPVDGEKVHWRPDHLPQVLNYLPSGEPLALEGRAPNWLYAAIALHTYPADFYQFDVRQGWIAPPVLAFGDPPAESLLTCRRLDGPDGQVTLDFRLEVAYLDYLEADRLVIPPLPPTDLLVISGRLPHWLTVSLAVACRGVKTLAVYQPQAGAVVVWARGGPFAPGDILPPERVSIPAPDAAR